jgi:hypothetical protein
MLASAALTRATQQHWTPAESRSTESPSEISPLPFPSINDLAPALWPHAKQRIDVQGALGSMAFQLAIYSGHHSTRHVGIPFFPAYHSLRPVAVWPL